MRCLAIPFTRCTLYKIHDLFLRSICSLEFPILLPSVITLLGLYLLSVSLSILLKNLTATPEPRRQCYMFHSPFRPSTHP